MGAEAARGAPGKRGRSAGSAAERGAAGTRDRGAGGCRGGGDPPFSPRAAWAGRRRAGSPSASAGTQVYRLWPKRPQSRLAGRGPEGAVPGGWRLRDWAHWPRGPDSDLGDRQGAHAGRPTPQAQPGSQGEPSALRGPGGARRRSSDTPDGPSRASTGPARRRAPRAR